MTKTTKTPETLTDLGVAYDGSYYFIAGTGGDLTDWVESYEKALTEAGIGKPAHWYKVTGAQVNAYAAQHRMYRVDDPFQPDLTCLLFPPDDLSTGALALFKIQWQDRWFDDVVDNMRHA